MNLKPSLYQKILHGVERRRHREPWERSFVNLYEPGRFSDFWAPKLICTILFKQFNVTFASQSMKKALVTILSILYLTVSSGATINLHYCMGKLTGWDMSAKEQSKCGACKKAKKNLKDCCNDHQKILKATKDQKAPESTVLLIKHFSVIINSYPDISIIYSSSVLNTVPNANAPPASPQVPVYLRNGNFRI